MRKELDSTRTSTGRKVELSEFGSLSVIHRLRTDFDNRTDTQPSSKQDTPHTTSNSAGSRRVVPVTLLDGQYRSMSPMRLRLCS